MDLTDTTNGLYSARNASKQQLWGREVFTKQNKNPIRPAQCRKLIKSLSNLYLRISIKENVDLEWISQHN